MPLDKGSRLGSYEIVAAIGAGGMGEVYRARDTRLDRTVAIKVLAHGALHDGDLKQRFKREAKTISSLNHPHICTLHDIGQHNDIDFLVMDHLEGESLADRLAAAPGERSRPLAPEEVLRYAIEMAEALSEAHRLGIVHRDLKPGNVMITRSGVKLLDFGLAKLDPRPAGVTLGGSTVATLQQPLPRKDHPRHVAIHGAGKLEGKDTDSRTDIFAFGAVVFEMATGTKAFAGDSHASVIAGILERDPPPISATRRIVSTALDRVIQKCLAKSPAARWQTARDLADELKWIAEARPNPSHGAPDPAPAGLRSNAWRLVAATAALAVTGAAVGALLWNLARQDSSIQPVQRFAIQPPPSLAVVGPHVALSSDGRHLVYQGPSARGPQIYVRALDQFEARALPGTEGAGNGGFAFSPDDQWLAFVSGGRLKKVALTAGAPPIILSDLPDSCCAGGSMAWQSDDGIILPLISTGLVRVSGQGGTPVAVSTADTEHREIDHHSPAPLPNGKALLLCVHGGRRRSISPSIDSTRGLVAGRGEHG